MMKRISSAMPQLMAFLSADFGYLRSASAFSYAFWSQPLSSVGPIFVITLSGPLAGRSDVVNDSPDFVRKSLVLSQSVNLLHGPTKMWKLQSLACTVITFFVANCSSAGFT